MPAFIEYILQVNGALLLFYLAYLLILRRLTFYSLNRLFLLFGMLFSLLYPFINLSKVIYEPATIGNSLFPEAVTWQFTAVPNEASSFDDWQWANYLFIAAAIGMTIRLFIQLSSLYTLYRQSIPATYGKYKYRQINKQINPFSFWQSIYLNVHQHTEEELETVLRHEQLHIQGWHSLDILLVQAIGILGWLNPACWGMQKAVAETLEFSTDQKMLRAGINQKKYQYSLISMEYPQLLPSLVNNFNFSTIKKRIAMMNKPKSSRVQIINYAILPLLITGLTFIFSATQAQVKTGAVTVQEAEGSKRINVISTSAGQDTLVYMVDGKRIQSPELKTIDPNTIDNIEVIKGAKASSISGNQETQGVILITTKEGAESKKGTSLQEPKPSTETIEPNENILVVKGTDYENALILLNGQEVTYDELKKLKPEQIKEMEVLKGESARKVYGEKGAKGVIKITTN